MTWVRGPSFARPGGRTKFAGELPPSVVDGFLESWVRWREACADVRSAYESWGTCKSAQRPLAFAAYCAALDREEQAAGVYSVCTARLRAAKR